MFQKTMLAFMQLKMIFEWPACGVSDKDLPSGHHDNKQMLQDFLH